MKRKRNIRVRRGRLCRLVAGIAFSLFCFGSAAAQTSVITLQGKLNNSGAPASGSYDMRFRLFDTADGGNQVGSTLNVPSVTATAGIFTVQLDFGDQAYNGGDRWVEISVSLAGQNTFVLLTPRQRVTSAPYSIRSSNASNADNSQNLGGIPAAQYVLANDGRLSDARIPLPGSNDYIQNNTNSPQPGVDFNIGGTGTASVLNAQTQFNLAGNRIIGVSGGLNSPNSNIFVGLDAGANNTTGTYNSFFGKGAGQNNSMGAGNSFFGHETGKSNDGSSNSFFGVYSGFKNALGSSNSFFGASAGFENTSGTANSFFGELSGMNNTTGNNNSFFGRSAGQANSTGFSNSFFGGAAGLSNTTGSNVTLIGAAANVGSGDLSFATAIGAGAVVNSSNALVLGRAADSVEVPGGLSVAGMLGASIVNATVQFNIGGNRILSNAGTSNLFGGVSAGSSNTTGAGNSFFGRNAGQANTEGSNNSFFGLNAGQANTVGSNNAFFGLLAGAKNTTGGRNTFVGARSGNNNSTGGGNSFFGADAGFENTSGMLNSFFGERAGSANTTGSTNSFFGRESGVSNTVGGSNSFFGYQSGVFNIGGGGNSFFGSNAGFNNTQGSNNSFFGTSVGNFNTTGGSNAFFGAFVGQSNTMGNNNAFFGRSAGSVNTTGNNNTFVGSFADSAGDGFLDFATAIGSHATVNASDTIVIGKNAGTYHGFQRPADVVHIPGRLGIGTSLPHTKLHVAGDAEGIRIQGSAIGNANGAYLSFVDAGGGDLGYVGDGSSSDNSIYVTSYNADVKLFTQAGAALTATSTGNVSMLGGPAIPFNTAAQVFDNNNGPFKGLIARSIFMDASIGNGFDAFLASPVHVCARIQTLGSGFGGYALVRCTTSFSSAENKTAIAPFSGGLDIIRRLNPVSFRWKKGGAGEVGLNAEEVATIEPSLVTRNEKGEVDEVKENRLTAILINAIKQQQVQIESQQRQIELLKRIVCKSNPDDEVCKEEK